MRYERSGHTLQPTALVHEAFLRLVDQNRADWHNVPNSSVWPASSCAGYCWITHAPVTPPSAALPSHSTKKSSAAAPRPTAPKKFLAVDEILSRLADLDARQARVVELRYFGGLSVEETAEAMSISAAL
jgi:RNA polymerase sigma-70 factor, ECF subfamily